MCQTIYTWQEENELKMSVSLFRRDLQRCCTFDSSVFAEYWCLSLQITIQRDSGLDVTAPKHGKIDANNAPHVGGNQWAGGTG